MNTDFSITILIISTTVVILRFLFKLTQQHDKEAEITKVRE